MEKTYNTIDEFIFETFPGECKKMSRELKTPIEEYIENADYEFAKTLDKIIKKEGGSGFVCPKCGHEASAPRGFVCSECGVDVDEYMYGYDLNSLPQTQQDLLISANQLAHNEDTYTDGLKELNKLINKYPDFAEAYNVRAGLYLRMSAFDKAFSDITKALEFYNESVTYLGTRGAIYLALGEKEKALDDFNAAIKKDPNDDDKYENRGSLYLEMGKYEKALADLSRAVQLNPDNFIAHRDKAIAHTKLKQHKQAIEEYSFILEENPNFAPAYEDRALVHLEMNNPELALADLQKAISLFDPEDAAFEIKKCREKIAGINNLPAGERGEGV